MAGRYQGRHEFTDVDARTHRSIEVFWAPNGWFWRRSHGDAVGPFATSTEAYQSAKLSLQLATRHS